MKVGLFFGSFNPMHLGHKAIAAYIAEFIDFDQVWLIVSPQNPLKQKHSLLDENQRLIIIQMEVKDNPKLFASDIEFSLNKPSYTIDTLLYLKAKHIHHDFSLIIGALSTSSNK